MKNYSNECLYKDTYTIISMMDDNMRNKISNKFIEFLKENQDTNFEGTINNKIPLKEQELRYEVKLMLSLIYINYICDDEIQRKIQMQENENLKEFYNRDIFKEENENTDDEKIEKTQEENLEMITYKESFISKLLKKIKTFFNK